MKGQYVCIVILACLSLTGCASFEAVTGKEPPQAKLDPIVNGYFSFNGFRPYNGKIVEVGALGDSNRWGNIVSLDAWPLCGFGVSLIGSRIKLLPLEAGFGMVGYKPEPEDYLKEEEKEPPPDEEEQPEFKEI